MMRVLVIGLLALLPLAAQAATMSIVPSTTSVSQGDLVTARIMLDAQGTAINNAEATLSFPPSLLSVASVSKTPSIFSLWVAEPTFSNQAGTISYNGGLPTPGFNGSAGTVMTVTFLAKGSGTASLSLGGAAVRANDGLGTDVLQAARGTQISIVAPAPAPEPAPTPQPTPTPLRSTQPIVITSPTHPDESVWYANASPTLRWILPRTTDAVQLIADQDEDAVPSILYRPPIVEKTVAELEDGVWYFNLRYRTGTTWSPVSTYALRIDATAPEIADAIFAYDESRRVVRIEAAITDAISGVSAVEAFIDGKSVALVAREDGVYEASYSRSGAHEIILRAQDAAGNASEAAGTFVVSTTVLDTPLFTLGPITVRLLPVLLLMAFMSLMSLVAAIAIGILMYRQLLSPRTGRHLTRQKVHRALMLLRSDLDKQVKTLHKVKSGKELTRQEELLSTKIHKDISDLETYLYEETDILK